MLEVERLGRFGRLLMEADDGGGAGGADGNKRQEPPDKTFTQADLDQIINGVKAKFERQYENKLAEIEEARKLAEMSEAEKQGHLLKQYEAKIAEYERTNLINQYKVELSNKGINAELAKFVNVSDAEEAKQAIDYLAKFKENTEQPLQTKIAELEEKLKNAELRSGKLPTDDNGNPPEKKSRPAIY